MLIAACQGPDAMSGAVARHVTSARAAEDEGMPRVWPEDLLQSLVATCHSALRALPAAAPNLLATVNALAAVLPTAVSVRALTWSLRHASETMLLRAYALLMHLRHCAICGLERKLGK